MPLKSGGAVDNEFMRGRSNSGLISMGKVSENYLYVPGQVSPTDSTGVISKIRLSTLTEVATLTLAADETTPIGTVISGNFLYVICLTSPGKVVKINLASFTKVSTLTFAAGEDSAWAGVVLSGFLYVTCMSPSRIVKIDLSTFTEVGGLNLSFAEAYDIIAVGTNLYVSHQGVFGGGSPGGVTRVDSASFTETGWIWWGWGLPEECYHLVSDGTYLYASINTAPLRIAKITLSTFSWDDTLLLNAGENYEGAMSILGGFLYTMCNPNAVNKPLVKVALSTFTRHSALNLDSEAALNASRSLVIGILPAPYAYIGFEGYVGLTLYVDLIRVNLTDFSSMDKVAVEGIAHYYLTWVAA